MGNYTQGPWKLYRNDQSVGDARGYAVCDVWPRGDDGMVSEEGKANARRIVACVNACRNLSNDELEQKGIVTSISARFLAAERSRDELLAALELMVAIHDEPSGFSGKYGKALDDAIQAQEEKIDERLLMARTAIAKAKGGAA